MMMKRYRRRTRIAADDPKFLLEGTCLAMVELSSTEMLTTEAVHVFVRSGEEGRWAVDS
jgi:hypothetical protein